MCARVRAHVCVCVCVCACVFSLRSFNFCPCEEVSVKAFWCRGSCLGTRTAPLLGLRFGRMGSSVLVSAQVERSVLRRQLDEAAALQAGEGEGREGVECVLFLFSILGDGRVLFLCDVGGWENLVDVGSFLFFFGGVGISPSNISES